MSVPPNCEHGIRNTGTDSLEFVYVYQTDSIEDIEHLWSSRSC